MHNMKNILFAIAIFAAAPLSFAMDPDSQHIKDPKTYVQGVVDFKGTIASKTLACSNGLVDLLTEVIGVQDEVTNANLILGDLNKAVTYKPASKDGKIFLDKNKQEIQESMSMHQIFKDIKDGRYDHEEGALFIRMKAILADVKNLYNVPQVINLDDFTAQAKALTNSSADLRSSVESFNPLLGIESKTPAFGGGAGGGAGGDDSDPNKKEVENQIKVAALAKISTFVEKYNAEEASISGANKDTYSADAESLKKELAELVKSGVLTSKDLKPLNAVIVKLGKVWNQEKAGDSKEDGSFLKRLKNSLNDRKHITSVIYNFLDSSRLQEINGLDDSIQDSIVNEFSMAAIRLKSTHKYDTLDSSAKEIENEKIIDLFTKHLDRIYNKT